VYVDISPNYFLKAILLNRGLIGNILPTKPLDIYVCCVKIVDRKLKGVRQMNKKLIVKQAVFYYILLSKRENRF